MVQFSAGIYNERVFLLKDKAGDSSTRCQKAVIVQGCPLFPYLFIIARSVMFCDVDQKMDAAGLGAEEPQLIIATDLFDADDDKMLASSG
eukprot:6457483-Pyramimonas_sp.AAC.1